MRSVRLTKCGGGSSARHECSGRSTGPGALNYGQALALSTILMLFCGGGMLAIESLRFGTVGEI